MAFVVLSGAPDFWNVTADVHPNPHAVTTDVMLVQALLVAYFSSATGVRPDLKAKAWTIISGFGKRFDNGIYGASTRQVMSLFEEDMRSPFRDGIVRRAPIRDLGAPPETKLKRLNFAWNMNLSDAMGTTKKESGRSALQPALFRELYRDYLRYPI